MASKDFTYTITTDRSPEEVFKAVLNVRNWWVGYYNEVIKGGTEKLDDEFTFLAGDGVHYSRQRLVEVIPNKKVIWLITDSKLSFIEKTDEWVGSKVIFDISEKAGKTKLVFTHEGLTPEVECYDSCAPAWTTYLQNKLTPLINAVS
ncbi:SRPBCC domain-containing protein [Pseudoflavitalea sp. G-6-1-2]|uniref:SRPBCC family protein n=1 Tax=Pseudoflavitalea sp. G-6-1-2 TaxID=2728841 RepID=UPI00146A9110|nr:SRPBCC domain-containing protein [Pseudoflavitalea sp. G-6-1-2]NML22005.1 SRPBCC domain-containing protein [Pseudoflavitalea sp. G-6-1-2]